ncbi:MAG: ABC transporter permease [Prevotella sp.]|jgi:hypothetical protein
MSLVWKLLRQHISVPQFAGFALANLFGMCIVLSGYQFYNDVMPVFTAEDSFMKTDYVILSKKIGTGNTFSRRSNSFDNAEINDLAAQPFATKVGRFTSTEYKVDARIGVNGTKVLNTELFFESIPDEFVDVPTADWTYKPGDKRVPIILPRNYLTMYNFGFARSHALPKISEGLVGLIDVDMFIQGNGRKESFKGKVIGFSNRLSSVLIPQTFMDWSNANFAPDAHSDATRLVMQSDNPADENVTKYLKKKGYEVEDGQLKAEKTTRFLRMMVMLVMVVGLIISALSFYILMLSIYLLVQKNAAKLENLLLMGYSPGRVARPYQLLTIGLNVVVLLIAWAVVFLLRSYYMNIIETLFPDVEGGSMWPAVLLGIVLFALVSLCNGMAIRHKIMKIWKRRD